MHRKRQKTLYKMCIDKDENVCYTMYRTTERKSTKWEVLLYADSYAE